MNKLRDQRKKNWFYLENALVDREDLTANEKLVYMILARYADVNDEAFPSYNTISKKSSLSKRTIINVIKKLVQKELIKKTQRLSNPNSLKLNNSNLYRIFSVEIPSEMDAQPLVQEIHYPSAGDAPPLVQEVHHPSAGAAPKKDSVKNTQLKNKTSMQIKNLRKRYSDEQLIIIDNYFDALRWTRKHGKIADSVILKIYEKWKDFKPEAVIYALRVYIDNPNYHDKKENYCYGIMRNATAEQIDGYSKKTNNDSNAHNQANKKPNNKFHNFNQRTTAKYSNVELEKKLGVRK